MTRSFAGIYAILDAQILRGRDPADLVAAAVRGGASTIQVRAKTMSTRDFVHLAERARAGAGSVRVLINDRLDVALASGADGVHIGRDDMDAATARRLLGAGKIIGVTIKSSSDFAAIAGNVDYGCIGGVFATRHKDNPDAPVGIEGFKALRREARRLHQQLPMGAIAGITPDNAGALATADADFVAVVGAVFATDAVEHATRALATAFAAGRVS